LDPASNSILLNDVGITALDAPVSPVPAPSTMMLAAIGLSSLGIYGRFRRTAS
jgi:hypothetical protein